MNANIIAGLLIAAPVAVWFGVYGLVLLATRPGLPDVDRGLHRVVARLPYLDQLAGGEVEQRGFGRVLGDLPPVGEQADHRR